MASAPSGVPSAALFDALAADLRALAHESMRGSQGAGGIVTAMTGWLGGSDHPQVREAAEHASASLRAAAERAARGHAPALREASADVLRPVLMVCDARHPRMVAPALGCLQKMAAHDAIPPEAGPEVVAALLAVERGGDDGVRLRLLQTSLTLLQSAAWASRADAAGAVLSLCLRMHAGGSSAGLGAAAGAAASALVSAARGGVAGIMVAGGGGGGMGGGGGGMGGDGGDPAG